MISLFKGLIPGAILTWVVCLFMGSGGSRGGFLNIHELTVAGFDFYWSWILFIAGTGLSWFVFQFTR